MHGHSPLPLAVARILVRTLPRGKRPLVMSTEHNRWRSHRLTTRWMNRVTGRHDAAAFAVSDQVRESMRGPAAAHAVTLVHGIDVAAAAGQRVHRAAVRSELGLAPDALVVGTVANFRAQTECPNLLGAVHRLVAHGVAVQVVAVGQGPQEAATRTLAEEP